MGVVRAQTITEDRASGGQVIDGSLRFDDGSKNYLTRTPGSSGNRDTWTYSLWIKRGVLTSGMRLLDAGTSDTEKTAISLLSNSGLEDQVQFYHISGGQDYGWNSTLKLRDNSGWYHLVFVYNSPSGTGSERMRGYINGVEITDFATDYGTLPQNQDSFVNHTNAHTIGKHVANDSTYYDGYMSQVYLIDGQALSPTDFGFTDGLTNTWRPKKYTGTYGTNGFYLPLDGNSLIGEDKSGNGNDFTPVNFGGSNTLEKATGAFPILNTDGGGKVARVGVRTDAYASNLVLALPLVGVSSDVSNQINSGSTTKTITVTGNAVGVSTFSNFYGGSFYFDGYNDYLRITANNDFNFGAPSGNDNDFTIEWWKYWLALDNPNHTTEYHTLWSNNYISSPGLLIQTGNGDGKYRVFFSSGTVLLQETNAPTVGRWYHYALVRNGTTITIYRDGVPNGSATTSSTAGNGSVVCDIGQGGGDYYEYGHIQDFRVYKGVAKYTSNFIPASTNPDILPDTPSGVAGGSALTKITDGAVYFDGTSDYLAVTNSNDFDFDGTFTMEAFVYADTLAANPVIFSRGGGNTSTSWSATNGAQFALYVVSTGVVRFEYNNGSNGAHNLESSAGSVVAKRWHHIAVTYDATTFTLWVDGVSVATGTGAPTMPTTRNLVYVGMWPTSANIQEWQGYISNLRFVKGTQLYTSNFTPPTEPLTNVTNTTLLCCQDTTAFVNGGQPILNTNSTGTTTTSGTRHDPYASSIVLALAMNGSNGGTTFTDIHPTIKGSGSAKTITVNGDAQTSTAESKYYGSSGLFDGTGDYLSLSGSTDFELTGEFTIEYYLYLTSSSGENPTVSWGNGSFKAIFSDGNGDWKLEYPSTGVVIGGKEILNTWVHYALTRDSGNNVRWFIDGKLQSTNSISSTIGSTDTFYIGRKDNSANHVNGYIQDLRIYKGAAKYTSDFKVTAPTVETPAAVTPGSITANGNAVATTLNPFTTDINTVRGQETSYPTLNPLFQQANVVLSNGNLDFTVSDFSSAKVAATTYLPVSEGGKYYWEVTQTSRRRVAAGVMNVVGTGYSFANSSDIGLSPHEWGIRFSNSSTQGAGTAMHRSHNSEVIDFGNIGLENGDTVQIALDLDNTSIWFGANGSWMGGDPETNNRATYTNLTGEIVPFVQRQTGTSGCKINFGQKPFKYAPPEGFKPITLTNLPRPTKAAVRPDKYFKTVLYTGDQNGQTINVGFEPSLIWGKQRNDTDRWFIADTVRGKKTTGYYLLSSHLSTADTNSAAPDGITDISSTGFTLGANSSNDDGGWSVEINQTGGPYVAYCWNAGGAAVENTDGSITSQVSANQDAGFSIVSYTGNGTDGSTVGHGLGVSPSFILTKNRDGGDSGAAGGWWSIYHPELPNKHYYGFNDSDTSNSVWNNHGYINTVSSTTWTLRTGDYGGTSEVNNWWINASGKKYIAYCWAEIEGFSKFGTFEGNGNANGPFVELGFRPAMVIVRGIDNNSRNWLIDDATRNPYNGKVNTSTFSTNYATLAANSSSAEPQSGAATFEGNYIDFLSNGFKLRSTAANSNGSETYIYAAWAEAPTFNLYGAQANAR